MILKMLCIGFRKLGWKLSSKSEGVATPSGIQIPPRGGPLEGIEECIYIGFRKLQIEVDLKIRGGQVPL